MSLKQLILKQNNKKTIFKTTKKLENILKKKLFLKQQKIKSF